MGQHSWEPGGFLWMNLSCLRTVAVWACKSASSLFANLSATSSCAAQMTKSVNSWGEDSRESGPVKCTYDPSSSIKSKISWMFSVLFFHMWSDSWRPMTAAALAGISAGENRGAQVSHSTPPFLLEHAGKVQTCRSRINPWLMFRLLHHKHGRTISGDYICWVITK